MDKHSAHAWNVLIHAAEEVNISVDSDKRFNSFESYSVACMLSGQSLFLVNAEKFGGNIYIDPLCQHIGNQSDGANSSNIATVSIVLVATRKRMIEVRQQCEKLVKNIVSISSSEELLKAHPKLLNSCDLLIITPIQLKCLLDNSNLEQLFASNRLNCIVIDNLERMAIYAPKIFNKLIVAISQLCDVAEHKLQLVVNTHLWQKRHLEKLIKHAKRPMLQFKDMLEAAVYGQVVFKVASCEGVSEQIAELLDYLKMHPPNKFRTLIYCDKPEEMSALLSALGTDCYLLHRGRQDKARIERWQQQTNGKILVLNDPAPELCITNVQSLIHFSLPQAWCNFRERFSVFSEVLQNALIKADPRQLHTLILFNNASNQTLPYLIEFMQQHEMKIPSNIVAAHDQLQAANERSLIARKCVMCPVLLLYGSCLMPTCQYRHMLYEADAIKVEQVPTVPKIGSIRFQILKICTPTHYAVRLLSYKPTINSEWITLPYQQQYADLQAGLKTHYATSKRQLTSLKLQQICVVEIAVNNYQRVCITHIDEKHAVRVKNLDLNTAIYHVKSKYLLFCPLEFQQIQPLALDVRIAGIVPYNGEAIWQSTETDAIAEFIDTSRIFEATVEFALSHTIFIQNLSFDHVDVRQQLEKRCLGRFEDLVHEQLKKVVCNVYSA